VAASAFSIHTQFLAYTHFTSAISEGDVRGKLLFSSYVQTCPYSVSVISEGPSISNQVKRPEVNRAANIVPGEDSLPAQINLGEKIAMRRKTQHKSKYKSKSVQL